MVNDPSHLREFGGFRIDLKKKVLWYGDEPVSLAAKAVELLCVLIEYEGEIVTKGELLERVWPDSFVEESVLSQNVHHLRKTLKDLSSSENLIQTIPRRGYRFAARVTEFESENGAFLEREVVERSLVAEVGGRSLEDLDPYESSRANQIAASRGKPRLILVAILVPFILLLAGFVVWQSNRPRGTRSSSSIKSIAVLPLKSFAPNTGDDALRLRITDALITKVCNLEQITVRPTNSVLKLGGEGQDPIEAGKTLQVDAVLDGRIQSEENRLRITLQLISVENGEQLWSEQFDGKANEILALQDVISNRLNEIFAFKESDRFRRPPTRSSEAYEAYLKGRYLWNQRTADSYWKALGHFQEAVEIDPDFALGYAGIADCYYLLNQRNALSADEAFQKAEAAARKALDIDPTLAEAHVSLGTVITLYYWRWEEGNAHFKRAIEVNPNYAEAHARLGMNLTTMSKFGEGLAALQQAERMDPTSLNIAIYFGANYYYSKQYERALVHFHQVLQFAPNVPGAYFYLARIYEKTGRFDEAVEAQLKDRLATMPQWVEPLREAYRSGGIQNFWRKHIELLREGASANPTLEFYVATRFALLNDAENALHFLEKNQNRRGAMWHSLRAEPLFDSLRDDPRFVTLVSRLNMPD